MTQWDGRGFTAAGRIIQIWIQFLFGWIQLNSDGEFVCKFCVIKFDLLASRMSISKSKNWNPFSDENRMISSHGKSENHLLSFNSLFGLFISFKDRMTTLIVLRKTNTKMYICGIGCEGKMNGRNAHTHTQNSNNKKKLWIYSFIFIFALDMTGCEMSAHAGVRS